MGREAAGPAEKYRGKLVTAEMAKTIRAEGIREIDTVANFLSAYSARQPWSGPVRSVSAATRTRGRSMPLDMVPFGSHGGPGRYDIGIWEHNYYSQ